MPTIDGNYLTTPKYRFNYPVTDQKGDPQAHDMARMFIICTPKKKQNILDATADSRTKSLLRKLLISDDDSNGYFEFLVQDVSAHFAEKVVTLDGLADKYTAFAFGTEPPQVTFSIALLNNKQDNQVTNMHLLYREILRALQLSRWGLEVHVAYNRRIVSGVIRDFQWVLRAEDESTCLGQFTLLVRAVNPIPKPRELTEDEKAEFERLKNEVRYTLLLTEQEYSSAAVKFELRNGFDDAETIKNANADMVAAKAAAEESARALDQFLYPFHALTPFELAFRQFVQDFNVREEPPKEKKPAKPAKTAKAARRR